MTEISIEKALDTALGHHQAGRFAEAEALYREILARVPNHPGTLHLLGVLAGQVGQSDLAVTLIGRAIAISPGDADFHGNLGAVLENAGHLEGAIAAYREAFRLNPSDAVHQYRLACVLQKSGKLEEAAECFASALRLDPRYGEARRQLGILLEKNGRRSEAINLYRQGIGLGAASPDLFNELGNALRAEESHSDAIEAYQEAIRLNPQFAEAYNNLANGLYAAGHREEAIRAYEKAIELRPDYAEAITNLAIVLSEIGRIEEAGDAAHRALQLVSDFPEAHHVLGTIYQAKHQFEEAIVAYGRAVELSPGCAVYRFNLGTAFAAVNELDDAILAYRGALALRSDYPAAYNNLGVAHADRGDIDEALECFRNALRVDSQFAAALDNLARWSHFHPDFTAHMILGENRRWEQHLERLFSPRRRYHPNDLSPDRKLRIGYISTDFRTHIVGSSIAPLFREINPELFETVCYSTGELPDEFTRYLKSLVTEWRDVAHLTDQELADLVADDRVDILVDLILHAPGNRLGVFQQKPVPVQVSYLGYPSTTGLKAIDYRLSDPYLDPGGGDLSCYSEQTIRLERSYWCYEPVKPAPLVSSLPALDTGSVTFGFLGNFSKASTTAVNLWKEVLSAVPGSNFHLVAPPGSCRDRILRALCGGNISPERIQFITPCPWEEYVRHLQALDITLDSTPHGGGISTCDALWMGVPVVTLSGETAVGRGGRSILSNIGLPELIAETRAQYVEIAVSLARDLVRLQDYRLHLRERMNDSPLRDAQAFARGVEAAFREMWRNWCLQASPMRSSKIN